MSELEEWRRKMRENAISDPDQILEYMRKNVNSQLPPYRLELLYDNETKTVLLQGNVEGLQSLLDALTRLIGSGVGAHAHFDRVSGMSKCDARLIIQRVDDTGEGPHVLRDKKNE